MAFLDSSGPGGQGRRGWLLAKIVSTSRRNFSQATTSSGPSNSTPRIQPHSLGMGGDGDRLGNHAHRWVPEGGLDHGWPVASRQPGSAAPCVPARWAESMGLLKS